MTAKNRVVHCEEPSHWFWKKTKDGEELSGPVGFNVAVLLGLIKVFHKKNGKRCLAKRKKCS